MRYNKSNRFLCIDGERKTLTEWAEESGVPKNLIHYRLRVGWDTYRAVWEPPRRYANGKEQKSGDSLAE